MKLQNPGYVPAYDLYEKNYDFLVAQGQKLDTRDHWVLLKHSPQKLLGNFNHVVSWIEINLVDSVLQLSNNSAQICKISRQKMTGSPFSTCSFIKMLFFCWDMLYRLCKQYDHATMSMRLTVNLPFNRKSWP